MANEIRNNTRTHRFELEMDGDVAAAHYRMAPGVITFTHTGVPDGLSGRGIGSRLAKYVLDYARAEGLKVDPQCPFISAYMKKHPDWDDLRV